MSQYKYIYGPVSSWRLGRSLGVDPISQDKKYCTFDCVYCQLGRNGSLGEERKVFVETQLILDEIKKVPDLTIDYITFSGTGEPTLAKNLGELIGAIKEIRTEKIAVLTNSSLLNRKDVREELSMADFVIAKLDAPSKEVFDQVNNPASGITFKKTLEGIKEFKQGYRGRLGLQVMFVDSNIESAPSIAALTKDIDPDEVQINTPLRHSDSGALSKVEIERVKSSFLDEPGLAAEIITVYESEHTRVTPLDKAGVIKRRKTKGSK